LAEALEIVDRNVLQSEHILLDHSWRFIRPDFIMISSCSYRLKISIELAAIMRTYFLDRAIAFIFLENVPLSCGEIPIIDNQLLMYRVSFQHYGVRDFELEVGGLQPEVEYQPLKLRAKVRAPYFALNHFFL